MFIEAEPQSKKALTGFLERKQPRGEIRGESGPLQRHRWQECYRLRSAPDKTWSAGKQIELPIAKATNISTHDRWRMFWQRADQVWHRYDPIDTVKDIQQFEDVVELDEFNAAFD